MLGGNEGVQQAVDQRPEGDRQAAGPHRQAVEEGRHLSPSYTESQLAEVSGLPVYISVSHFYITVDTSQLCVHPWIENIIIQFFKK